MAGGLANYETIEYIEKKNRLCSEKLLKSLHVHHDFNTHIMPERYEKPEPTVKPDQVSKAMRSFWKVIDEFEIEPEPITIKGIKRAAFRYFGVSIMDLESE